MNKIKILSLILFIQTPVWGSLTGEQSNASIIDQMKTLEDPEIASTKTGSAPLNDLEFNLLCLFGDPKTPWDRIIGSKTWKQKLRAVLNALNNGASANAKYNNGEVPLDHAVRLHDYALAQLLFTFGASRQLAKGALHTAFKKKDGKMISLFLLWGVEPTNQMKKIPTYVTWINEQMPLHLQNAKTLHCNQLEILELASLPLEIGNTAQEKLALVRKKTELHDKSLPLDHSKAITNPNFSDPRPDAAANTQSSSSSNPSIMRAQEALPAFKDQTLLWAGTAPVKALEAQNRAISVPVKDNKLDEDQFNRLCIFGPSDPVISLSITGFYRDKTFWDGKIGSETWKQKLIAIRNALENGASPDAKYCKQTVHCREVPLDHAARLGDHAMAQLLFEFGAHPQLAKNALNTSLKNKDEKMALLFLLWGVELTDQMKKIPKYLDFNSKTKEFLLPRAKQLQCTNLEILELASLPLEIGNTAQEKLALVRKKTELHDKSLPLDHSKAIANPNFSDPRPDAAANNQSASSSNPPIMLAQEALPAFKDQTQETLLLAGTAPVKSLGEPSPNCHSNCWCNGLTFKLPNFSQTPDVLEQNEQPALAHSLAKSKNKHKPTKKASKYHRKKR